MVSKRLARRSLAIANANVQTGVDAALTIAARTQDMMSFGEPAGKGARGAAHGAGKGRRRDRGRDRRPGRMGRLHAQGGVRRRSHAPTTCRWASPASPRPPRSRRGARCAPTRAASPGRRRSAPDMDLVHHLHGYLATYGYLAIFVIVGLESAGVPMPGETVLVAAAILAGRGQAQHLWRHRRRGGRRDRRRQLRLLGRARVRLSARLPLRPLCPPRRAAAEARPVSVPEARRQDRVLRPVRRRPARLRGVSRRRQSLQLGAVLPLQRGGRDRLGVDLRHGRLLSSAARSRATPGRSASPRSPARSSPSSSAPASCATTSRRSRRRRSGPFRARWSSRRG